MNGALVRLVVVAAVTGATAASFGLALSFAGPPFGPMLWAAPAAAVVVTIPLWWLAVERPGRRGWGRGGAVGAAAALLAYPLTLFLWQAGPEAGRLLGATGRQAADPFFLLYLVPLSLLLTPIALFFTGFLPVVVGVLAGAALTRLPTD